MSHNDDPAIATLDKSKLVTKTRSMPWMLGTTPVILIEGITGGYLLTRVKPIASTPNAP